jgi:hypothetical protein
VPPLQVSVRLELLPALDFSDTCEQDLKLQPFSPPVL